MLLTNLLRIDFLSINDSAFLIPEIISNSESIEVYRSLLMLFSESQDANFRSEFVSR